MANKSFQDHLDSMDAETKVRKVKVIDWIQRSSGEAWDRENQKKDEKDPRRLHLDPSTHFPSQPYQKQIPIYATADDPNSGNLELDPGSNGRNRSSGSLPNQSHLPDWRVGVNTQRYGMESRQRAVTVTGSKLVPNVGVFQRHHPPPAHYIHGHGAGMQGRVPGKRGVEGSGVQGSGGHQNVDPATYPTAKFEKDYYILDV